MLIAAIDPGNSRFKYATYDEAGIPRIITNRFGEVFTPSAVFFNSDGSIIVGTEALNAGFIEPDRLVTNWKRDMGTDKVLYTADDGRTYTSMDILSILLKDAKDNIEAKTGQVVNEAFLTIPANYNTAQIQQTKDAANKVGITAEYTPHEPTAAALGNLLHERNNCTALVYDLGGGTFDVSLIRSKDKVCTILATGGDPNIGGRDFNDRVAEKVLDEFATQNGFRPSKEKHPMFFQDMNQRIEQLKISLSVQIKSPMVLTCEGKQLNMMVTREQFNSWVSDIVKQTMDKTVQIIEEAGLGLSQIDEVYAVGGGAMIPLIRDMLEELTGKKISQSCEPHVAAACGAITAGRLEYKRLGRVFKCGDVCLQPPEPTLQDILSHSIGVQVLDEDNREVCDEILAKTTPIPSIQKKRFKLSEPNQTAVLIKVLEGGDGTPAENCLVLGHFDLKDLPLRPDLIGRIEVTFSLNSSGLLTAKARDKASGKTAEMEIAYNNNNSDDNNDETQVD